MSEKPQYSNHGLDSSKNKDRKELLPLSGQAFQPLTRG